ncbi:MAG: hypothetical protein KY476_09550 [Planctomycetes bacterium]|nr:hypothetical protein [Planctomycetota bacterium]
MIRIALAAIALMAACSSALQADGLVWQLPEDGSWVEYEATGTQLEPEEKKISTGKLLLRSVGTVMEGGEKNRWLELEFTVKLVGDDDRMHHAVYKYLIPEKHLGKGKSPIENVVRSWFQVHGRDQEPREISNAVTRDGEAIVPYLGPPLLDARQTEEKRRIEHQKGTVDAIAVRGQQKALAEKQRHLKGVTIWLAEEIPFGVAAMDSYVEVSREGEEYRFKAELVVHDFGTGAKSALPDVK